MFVYSNIDTRTQIGVTGRKTERSEKERVRKGDKERERVGGDAFFLRDLYQSTHTINRVIKNIIIDQSHSGSF